MELRTVLIFRGFQNRVNLQHTVPPRTEGNPTDELDKKVVIIHFSSKNQIQCTFPEREGLSDGLHDTTLDNSS